ncbi:MAG: hypothetical protein U0132_23930 [Gemmatimonadaceae bacterium]
MDQTRREQVDLGESRLAPSSICFIERALCLREDHSRTQFREFLSSASYRIVPIAVIGRIATTATRVLSIPIAFHLTILVVATIPIVLNIALSYWSARCAGEATLWILYYSVVTLLVFEFSVALWRYLVNTGNDLNSMFASERDRASIEALVLRRFDVRGQISSALIIGIASVCVLHLAAPTVRPMIGLCPASYIAVFIAATIGVCSAHWLCQVPLIVRGLFNLPELIVHWNAPASTPAIRRLANFGAANAVMGAFLMILFMIPPLYVAARQTTAFMMAINGVAMIFTLTVVAIITLPIQYWLTAIIRRERAAILGALGGQLNPLRDVVLGIGDKRRLSTVDNLANIYQSVHESRESTIDAKTLLIHSIAVATSILPYVVQFVARVTAR